MFIAFIYIITITEPFETFEQKHSNLVCLNSQGNAINRINFWEQEREEMYVLTKASQISKGVWVSLALFNLVTSNCLISMAHGDMQGRLLWLVHLTSSSFISLHTIMLVSS